MRRKGNYYFKINTILDRVWRECINKKNLHLNQNFEVKVVISALGNTRNTFIKDHIDIKLKPKEPFIIRRRGCTFYIYEDFYNINNEKVNPISIMINYYHLYQKYNCYGHEGSFRIDYKIIG